MKNIISARKLLFCVVLITAAIKNSKADNGSSERDPVSSYVTKGYKEENGEEIISTTDPISTANLMGVISTEKISSTTSTTSTTSTEKNNEYTEGGSELYNTTFPDLYNSTEDEYEEELPRILTDALSSLGG